MMEVLLKCIMQDVHLGAPQSMNYKNPRFSIKERREIMPERTVPDISHLRGAEVEKVAKALTSGTVSAVLEHKDALIGLKTEDIKKITDVLASAPVAHCGGFGCG
jgi:hypothetical protein